MTKIAIHCHPSIPRSSDELGDWLDHQVSDLRSIAPDATIRLSRLTQSLSSRDVEIGWLIELELSSEAREALQDRLLVAVRDMELLGFQPTVFEPVGVSELAAASNGSSREWW